MQDDLTKIIDSFHFQNELLNPNELFDLFKLNGDTCFFIFDINSDKCCYISPSIENILGRNHKKYLNKGYLFLKTIIHPRDFSFVITEILTLVKSSNHRNPGNNLTVSVEIKHNNGTWLKMQIHLNCLKNAYNNDIDILLGFIEREIVIQNENIENIIPISSREKEVLKHLAAGNSAKTIADKLYISENTVITHRKNLIQKLNVKNSAELIKRSFELNILN